jgi:hypothetical protein
MNFVLFDGDAVRAATGPVHVLSVMGPNFLPRSDLVLLQQRGLVAHRLATATKQILLLEDIWEYSVELAREVRSTGGVAPNSPDPASALRRAPRRLSDLHGTTSRLGASRPNVKRNKRTAGAATSWRMLADAACIRAGELQRQLEPWRQRELQRDSAAWVRCTDRAVERRKDNSTPTRRVQRDRCRVHAGDEEVGESHAVPRNRG